MEFSQKRPGKRVMNTLAFARTNATTQEKYLMDASKLYVGEPFFFFQRIYNVNRLKKKKSSDAILIISFP